MSKTLHIATGVSLVLTGVFALLYFRAGAEALLPLVITFGTISYHFCVRLLIGACFYRLMHNRADLQAAWYRPRPWERPLYDKLRVKRWKKWMPTYQPDLFDPRQHTWHEIAQTMCQSELVHETIIAASFLPLLAAIPFGAFPVFLITSVLAAAFDLCFVIMQRYNRPAVLRIAEREKNRRK